MPLIVVEVGPVYGSPATILPANYAFKAIYVSGGEHRIELRASSQPPGTGRWITAAGSSLVAVLLLLGYWQQRRSSAPT